MTGVWELQWNGQMHDSAGAAGMKRYAHYLDRISKRRPTFEFHRVAKGIIYTLGWARFKRGFPDYNNTEHDNLKIYRIESTKKERLSSAMHLHGLS